MMKNRYPPFGKRPFRPSPAPGGGAGGRVPPPGSTLPPGPRPGTGGRVPNTRGWLDPYWKMPHPMSYGTSYSWLNRIQYEIEEQMWRGLRKANRLALLVDVGTYVVPAAIGFSNGVPNWYWALVPDAWWGFSTFSGTWPATTGDWYLCGSCDLGEPAYPGDGIKVNNWGTGPSQCEGIDCPTIYGDFDHEWVAPGTPVGSSAVTQLIYGESEAHPVYGYRHWLRAEYRRALGGSPDGVPLPVPPGSSQPGGFVVPVVVANAPPESVEDHEAVDRQFREDSDRARSPAVRNLEQLLRGLQPRVGRYSRLRLDDEGRYAGYPTARPAVRIGSVVIVHTEEEGVVEIVSPRHRGGRGSAIGVSRLPVAGRRALAPPAISVSPVPGSPPPRVTRHDSSPDFDDKGRSALSRVVSAYHMATEVKDAVGVLADAIPGKPCSKLPGFQMALCVLDNFGSIDWGKASYGLVYNQLEDKFVAALNKALGVRIPGFVLNSTSVQQWQRSLDNQVKPNVPGGLKEQIKKAGKADPVNQYLNRLMKAEADYPIPNPVSDFTAMMKSY